MYIGGRRRNRFVTHQELAAALCGCCNVFHSGIVDPLESLGDNNDHYMNTQTGDIFKKIGGVWTLVYTHASGGGGGDGIYGGSGSLIVPTTVTGSGANTLTFDAGTANAGVTFNGSGTKVATFNGDIDVTGLIDPTGVQFTQQASNPGTVDTIWINSADGMAYRDTVNLEIPLVDNTTIGLNGLNQLEVIGSFLSSGDNISNLFNDAGYLAAANNGLNIDTSVIQLGGDLVENTLINIDGGKYFIIYDFTDPNNKLTFEMNSLVSNPLIRLQHEGSGEFRTIFLNDNELKLATASLNGSSELELDTDQFYIIKTTVGSTNPKYYMHEDGIDFHFGASVLSSPVIGDWYRFPIIDGLPNQVLATDGLGILRWESTSNLTTVSDAANGLNITVNPGVVELGGDLVRDTSIVGQATDPFTGYYLNIDNLKNFFLGAYGPVTIRSQDSDLVVEAPSGITTVRGTTVVIDTAGTVGNDGDVLTSTGVYAEWVTPTLSIVSVNAAASPYIVQGTEDLIKCNTVTGDVTIEFTLPLPNKRISIKKTSSDSNNVIIQAPIGYQVDDIANTYSFNTVNQSVTVICDSTGGQLWLV